MAESRRFVISRTDSLGDVLLTLPMAAALKAQVPGAWVGFVGSGYTRPLVAACSHVDAFLDWRELQADVGPLRQWQADALLHALPRPALAWTALRLGIGLRLGTSRRWYHWLACNRLVNLPRRSSDLHEAQLNLRLLTGLGLRGDYGLEEIGGMFGLTRLEPVPDWAEALLDDRPTVILHPKSKGSAREWPLSHYLELARLLGPAYRIFVTGTEQEAQAVRLQCPELLALEHVTDLGGRFSLGQLLAFMARCQALVACSTGPLHMAAALGLRAIGLYVPMRPLHPGRWAPLGPGAQALSLPGPCEKCRHDAANCSCIAAIRPQDVALHLTRGSDEISS